MEYPNKNLQTLLRDEAGRTQREHYLFGDSLDLMAPDKHLSTKFLFKRYGAAVLNAVDRHSN